MRENISQNWQGVPYRLPDTGAGNPILDFWQEIPPALQIALTGAMAVFAALGFLGMFAMNGHVNRWREAYREMNDHHLDQRRKGN